MALDLSSTYIDLINAVNNAKVGKTSELENDSGFITKSIVPNSLNSQFAVSSSGTDLTVDMTYENLSSALTTRQRALTYGNGIWVAGDTNGAIQYSTNGGATWTRSNTLINKVGGTETTTITGLAYGKGYFVATSYGDSIYKSLDGINWTVVDCDVTGLGDVIYANGRFVFVAKEGEVVFSDDLQRFELINIGSPANFATIAFGRDRFFTGTGDSYGNEADQRIYYSLDGLVWNTVESDVLAAGSGSDYWGGACYGKGKYLIGGRSRTLNGTTYSIAYSDDCVTWYPATCPTALFVRAITYIYGKFFAVGYLSSGKGEIWSSLDGINWTLEQTGLTRQWVITHAEDFLVTLGDSGAGMRYTFNVNWLDYEPEITPEEILWQKTQLRLTDGSLIESEVEVHTNLTSILNRADKVTITDLRGIV